MKRDWMAQLASHYETMRAEHPDDELMILFDIDGTILDTRHMVLHVLRSYDKEHETFFFKDLQVSDIKVHENEVDALLSELPIPENRQKVILDWYDAHRWSWDSILQSHRPFSGVLEVIRWFQLQPRTQVGLNTGRPEAIRRETLRSLNELGREYRVQFSDELMHMNVRGWEQKVQDAKVEGVRYFQKAGYRVFAFVDNEPENLKAVSTIDEEKEILLLHANTIFKSKRTRLPANSVKGKSYDLTELIPERALPRHIQFAWHGVNDEANLRQFLASDITWGECDVRLDPMGDELILRHDSFKASPFRGEDDWISLDSFLKRVEREGKSIKFDLKAGGTLVDKILTVTDQYGLDDSRIWFNANVERILEESFRKLARARPGAILQCPIDFLAPLIISAPQKTKEILDMFVSWGINRFSLSWLTEDMRSIFDQMDHWGFEVNIYNLPDLEAFLQAVLLVPRSITSDFNFPKWHYFGRGSGENGGYHRYSVRKSK